MSNLIPFQFEGAAVRVIEQDGFPCFVAADVARILEYGEAKDMVRMLDDDEKGRHLVPTHGGAQTMLTITESGLYSVILRSDKPKAKPFRKWVTSEVLPAIRKTGSYVHAAPDDSIERMKAETARLNAMSRALGEIRKSSGVRAAAKAAPSILARIGITITISDCDILDQRELRFTSEANQ